MTDRELDIQVSEVVFELKVKEIVGYLDIKHLVVENDEGDWEVGCLKSNLPNYSTKIEDAWLVVEKLHETNSHISFCLHKTFDWCNGPGLKYKASFDSYHGQGDFKTFGEAIEDTAPKAICLAAIKAIKEIERYFYGG